MTAMEGARDGRGGSGSGSVSDGMGVMARVHGRRKFGLYRGVMNSGPGTVRSNARRAATTTDQAKMTPGLLRQTPILATGT